MPITLYGAPQFRSGRCIWMLEELGLEYDLRPIQSRNGETQTKAFLQLNPRGKIPCLVDDGFVLSESAAINTYLGDKYGSDIVPAAGTQARATYDMWCYFIMSEIDAQSLYIHRKHVGLIDIYGAAPTAVEAAREYFLRQTEVVADQLKRAGPWVLGDTFTAADILLTHCLTWAARLQWLPPEETLIEYIRKAVARPAYIKALGAFKWPENIGRKSLL